MVAITQRINNFLGGVSTQPDTKKLPGQVKDAINVFPDPATGLAKRPGFKFLTNLHDGNGTDYTTPAFDNAKWFYINRDDDEVYIGCVLGNTNPSLANIHIWNATPDSNGNYVKAAVTFESYDGTDTKSYLNATTSKDYQILTVQDTSILLNKTFTVTPTTTTAVPDGRIGTVLIEAIEYSATYTIKINGTEYNYQTYNADVFSSSANTDTKLNADTILTGLKSAIDAASITGLTVTKGKNCLEFSSTTTFTLDAEGGTAGSALRSYQNEIDSFVNLPSVALHDRVVKIVNTNSGFDSYYAKFVSNTGSGISDGYWEETRGPGVASGFNKETMPHELVNTALNTFEFRRITYTERLCGDAVTNSDPSFVNNTINGVFFNRNRLGFLSGENVIMSQSGEFFNFYFTTATASTASDPVDLTCSSIRPLQLHAALPSPAGMLLFSQSQQFVMFSESGNLTPQDSIINGLSNYEMDKNISPVEVGTGVYFVSKTPSFTKVFSYALQGLSNPPQVLDIGKAVDQYIPSSITHVISNAQNSVVVLYGESDKDVYLYRFYETGSRQSMQAWFKWKLPGLPLSINIEQDVLYAVIQSGSKYFLCTLNLSSSTDEVIVTSSDGKTVNPYIDYYATASSVVSYNGGSRINLPYDDIADLDPVILVKGSGINFANITDSGFTAPVTKETIGGSTFFFLKGKDLSSQASNVVVGYKFNYDVKLPTIYYQQTPDGTRTDYSAYLTLGRLNFATTDVANFGLKFKVRGVRGQSFTFTGDGSKTVFTLPFTPNDRNDIVIKLDGVVNTSNTITHSGQITFTTAPANNSSILVYEDVFYTTESIARYDNYLADDVAIENEFIYTFPVNQRNNNVEIRVFNNDPFPISISSMTWEGQYSPRYIRRA